MSYKMVAEKTRLLYISNSMKEIDFLNNQYLCVDSFSDFSTPVIKSTQLCESLLCVLLINEGITVEGHSISSVGPDFGRNPFDYYINSYDIPNEIQKFLKIIRRFGLRAYFDGSITRTQMYEFSKAYKCFVCWYFEEFDIFGTEEEFKKIILEHVDYLEEEIEAPIEVEYTNDSSGRIKRTVRYCHEKNSMYDIEKTVSASGTISSLVENRKEKSDTEIIKEFFERKMSEFVEKIETSVENSNKEVSNRIDNMTLMLSDLISKITSYQSLVQSQIELAVTADEVDRIIHAYSEEYVNKIIKGVEEKYSNTSREEEKKKLIGSLGKDLWDEKLSPESKTYLISSKVTYNYYLNMDMIDFSGVCLLVTKALEVELSKRFYHEYVAFLKQCYIDNWKEHLDEFPTTLIKIVNGSKVLKSSKDFTLGSVAYILCANDDRNATEGQIENNRQKLVEFSKSKLMPGKTDEEILTILQRFGEKIADVTKEYRNKAAHTNELTRVDAEMCFRIVLDTEQLLKKMLDTFII